MKHKSLFATALILLLICGLCGALVAGVNALTSPRIQRMEEETLQSTIHTLYPRSSELQSREIVLSQGSIERFFCYEDESGALCAYAAIVAPGGFNGAIRLCVAVSPRGEIIGVRVLSSGETPGVGDRACAPEYLQQYNGLRAPLSLGEKVDAVTGATISSRAILSGVNEVLAFCATQPEKGEGV